MFRAGLTAILLLALLALASCGGGMATARDAAFIPVPSLDRENSIGADSATVALVPSGDSFELKVAGLQDAKAVYGEIQYDPSLVHLSGAITTGGESALADGALTDSGQIVMVVDQPEQDRIVFGMVLANWPERDGIDGELSLATLSFSAGPSPVVRVTALAPGPQPYNDVVLEGTKNGTGHAVLTWEERLAGDGGNDAEVSISDLTPLGAQLNKNVTDSVTSDADFDKNGQVNISDLTAMGSQLGATLGGYKILASPTPTGTFTEVDEVLRTELFPEKPPLGEVEWTWTSPTPLTADTSYKVVGFDKTAAKALAKESNVVSLSGTPPVANVTAITRIEFDDPNSVVIDAGGGVFRIIVTEESVDPVVGNVDDFSLETLQLRAYGFTDQSPSTEVEVTDDVLWYVTEGGGLAQVSNAAGSEGVLSPADRGTIEVTAQAKGNFNVTNTITFELLTIESVAVTGPGTSPVAINEGQSADLTVAGTFDSDNDDASGNEVTLDITDFVRWASLEDETADIDFQIQVSPGVASVFALPGSSGDGIRVSAEYPRTNEITLHDHQKRVSPFFRVDVN